MSHAATVEGSEEDRRLGGANSSRLRGTAGRIVLVAIATIAAAAPASAQETTGRGVDGANYPYVPTPPNVVAEMLEMADVSARDSVYDLGSGDGRIVVTAARRYGAAGLGVELDSTLVSRARDRVRSEGVGDRVEIVRGNLFEVDLSPATVVTLYLLPRTMDKLEPKLFRELRPGARVVAHDFDMARWQPDSVARTPGGLGGQAALYYWLVPARVGGAWALSLPGGDSLRVRIDQRYQELRAESTGHGGARVLHAHVAGDSVRLRLSRGDESVVVLRGTVDGDRMRGRVDGGRWSGRRVAETDSVMTAWDDETSAASRSGDGSGGPPLR